MTRCLSMLVALSASVGLAALVTVGGCSSSPSDPGTGPKADTGPGGNCSSDPKCSGHGIDPNDPPVACGPVCGLKDAKSTAQVDGCPSDNACMAPVKQSGNVLNYRMGRIRLWAPEALLSLTALAVDPNVNAKCFNNGNESFNWLLQVDKTKNTLLTGGAQVSADHKTFAFLSQKVDGKDLSGICPGFVGPDAAIDLSPISLPITFTGNVFKTDPIKKVNIPIFDGTTTIPIILPLQDGIIKNVTIGDDPTCIGSWNKNHWDDGDTLGWTTGGVLTGKMTVDDADRVPVKTAGCQSLCAILANDSSKTTGKTCKHNADGTVVAGIGDTTTTDGHAAFLLSATFSAFGVDITGAVTPPPGDAGPGDAAHD